MNSLSESKKIILNDLRSYLLSSLNKISKDLDFVKKLKLAQERLVVSLQKSQIKLQLEYFV